MFPWVTGLRSHSCDFHAEVVPQVDSGFCLFLFLEEKKTHPAYLRKAYFNLSFPQ